MTAPATVPTVPLYLIGCRVCGHLAVLWNPPAYTQYVPVKCPVCPNVGKTSTLDLIGTVSLTPPG